MLWNLNQRAKKYIRNDISARKSKFAGGNVISYVLFCPLIQISKHLRADVDLNEDPIDINSSDHLRSGWDKSPKETESVYSIASLLYPWLSSKNWMIFFYNLEDFSNIFYFISYRSIKLPIDLHYRPLEQTSNLASEFYFFSKVLAFLDDILTLACGSGQNII